MTKVKSWLSALLGFQILLTMILIWSNQRQQQDHLQIPLLIVDQQQLDRVVISDKDNSISFSKSADQWLLPALKALPADQAKVDTLLSNLLDLKSGWPVAKTAASHQRFEVAEDKFQRRIQFFQGEKQLAELFVGTSPGFRKVHVRKSGDDSIYTAKLSNYEILANNEEWLDKTLLAGADDISTIKTADFTLKKDDGQWGLSESRRQTQPENTVLNVDAAEQLASALGKLRVKTLASDAIKELMNEQEAVVIDVLTPKQNWVYQFYSDKEKYYVSRNDRSELFEIIGADYERIAKIDLSKIIQQQTSNDDNSEQVATGQ